MDVSAIFEELNDHGFDDASDDRKLSMLNSAYRTACSREPWPFLENFVRLTFTGTSYEPETAPPNFQAVISMKLEGVPFGGGRIKNVREDDYDVQYGDNTIMAIGNPQVYYVDGQRGLHFYPAPSSNQVVRMRYLQYPPALTATSLESDILIPEPFQRDILVNGAAYRLYSMNDDTDIAPVYQTYFENALSDMREWAFRKQYTDPQIIHPTDQDDLGLDWLGTPFGVI